MAVGRDEVYFPRGRSSSQKPPIRKTKNTLFSKHKKPKRKIKQAYDIEEKLSKREVNQLESLVNKKHFIASLTYQTLQEGMVVLARVREIWPYHMFVCLPGRLSAKLPVAAISAPYTKALEAAALNLASSDEESCLGLNELFRVGQSVVCSVVQVVKKERLLAVLVSLEPSLVNKGLHIGNVKAGTTLVAAIRSQEDHGYSLHTGIPGLTAFLPHNQAEQYIQRINAGRTLTVGEVVRCLVSRCKTAENVSRVEVTVDPDALNRSVVTNLSSKPVLPGTRVRCTVEEVNSQGLVMGLADGSKKAYVENSQLKYCWSAPEHYKPQTELIASLLYVLPQTGLLNPNRPLYLTLKDLTHNDQPKISLGATVQAVVTDSCKKGVTLCLGETQDNDIGNKGIVSVRRLGDRMDKKDIASRFPKGLKVTTKVLAYDYMLQAYNCSLEKDKFEQQFVRLDQISVGDRVSCEVTDIEEVGIKLSLGFMRLYAYKDHSADVPYTNLYQSFARGNIVDGRVLKVNPETRFITLTLKETLIRSPALCTYKEARVGDSYWGTIVHVRDNSLYVSFYGNVVGTVQLGDSHGTFLPGHLVKCYITYVNKQTEKLLMSLSPPAAKPARQLTLGRIYQLVVSHVQAHVLQVSACDFDGIDGMIPKCHMSNPDTYGEGDFLKARFYLMKGGTYYFSPSPAVKGFSKPVDIKLHSAITCCVAEIKDTKIMFDSPLTEYKTVCSKKGVLANSLEPYQIVKVFVKNINEPKKMLIVTFKEPLHQDQTESNQKVDDKNQKSLGEEIPKKSKLDKQSNIGNDSCPLKQKDPIHLLKKTIINEKLDFKSFASKSEIGLQEIKTKKHKANKLDKEVGCTVGNDSGTSTQKDLRHLKNENRTKDKSNSKNADFKSETRLHEGNTKKRKIHLDEEGNVLITLTNNESRLKHDSKDPINFSKELISVSKETLTESGFQWDLKLEDLNKPEESFAGLKEDDEEETIGTKKKSVAERRKRAKDEEARLRRVEQTLLDSETNPQSVDQFDRAVLARPDDADLWVKYMSHHLQATEIEKARSVARRALQTISQRLEVERLNVWIALLNLENLFGTPESIKECLHEALRTNDEFTVYCKMLKIYSDSTKPEDTERLVNVMVRKFRCDPTCWIYGCSAMMEVGLSDKARSLLQRAISALPTKDHINLLCKFALLENQHGFGEQSQTLFEHILTSYPKRTDIWNVYVDMLVKSGKTVVARQILERAAGQKLPPRKMKMLFSKWISFEEQHGTPERVDHVRSKTLEYVNNITKKLQ